MFARAKCRPRPRPEPRPEPRPRPLPTLAQAHTNVQTLVVSTVRFHIAALCSITKLVTTPKPDPCHNTYTTSNYERWYPRWYTLPLYTEDGPAGLLLHMVENSVGYLLSFSVSLCAA